MLGFVKYSKLSIGHEKAQKVDGFFCIFSIYYVYYFYRHFNDYQIRINSVARKLSQERIF